MECVIYLFFSPSGRFFISALLPRLSGCRNRSGYRLPDSLYQWATIYFRGCPWCQQSSPGPWAETATSELRSPSPGIHYVSSLFGLSSDLYRITQWPRSAPKRCRILARFQWAKTSHNLFVRSSSSPSSVLTKCYTKYLIYHGKCQCIKSNFVLCCFCRVVFCTTFVQEDVNGGPGCPQH